LGLWPAFPQQISCFFGGFNRYGLPILYKGQAETLGINDVHANLPQNESSLLGEQLERTLLLPQVKNSKRPLLKALMYIYGWQYAWFTLNGYLRDGVWR